MNRATVPAAVARAVATLLALAVGVVPAAAQTTSTSPPTSPSTTATTAAPTTTAAPAAVATAVPATTAAPVTTAAPTTTEAPSTTEAPTTTSPPTTAAVTTTVAGASILPATTTAPGAAILPPTTTVPGASILPATTVPGASILPSTTVSSKAGQSSTGAPSGGISLPARGSAATPAAGQSPLLQLLAAAEAARRQLDTQIAEAEAALAQREAELAAGQAALAALESQVTEAQGRVDEGTARVKQFDDLLARLTVAKTAAEAVAQLKTTPVARPATTGHTARDEVTRTQQALAGTSAARSQMATIVRLAQETVDDSSRRTVDTRRVVANLSEELEQRRNSLANLRQQLAAAVAAGAAANVSAVRSLTAEAGQAEPSALALTDIPSDYLSLYRQTAPSCPGLSWTVLAAIGSIESSHGRSRAPGVHSGENFAGAMGPMQFLAPTWAAYGRDANGDNVRDVYNPADAVAGAANYLCANGGGQLATLASAIWNYNHADWYVASVIQLAGAYGGAVLAAPRATVDVAQLLANKNLTLTGEARSDILTGNVDPRVVQLLASAASQHRISVSVLKTGHSKFVRDTDRVSNHYACDGCPGRAVDIYEVDGAPVSTVNVAALQLALSILTADAPLRPDEFGSPWPELSRFPGGFSDGDHQGHLHIGWRAA